MIFITIWFGQLISLIGSSLTGFALGVWVYQRTGSTTQFALISLFTVLPGIVISPLAGALVDRWDRRWAMILSDFGGAISMLAIMLLLISGHLEVWYIYIIMGIDSAFSAFRWPAFSAMTTLLVPKHHLSRASGMVQTGEAVTQVISPVLAGILMAIIQIHGLLLIDLISFLFAIITLLLVQIPRPETSDEGKASKGSLLGEAAYGWIYIIARPGLFALLVFFAATNFITGIVQVLLTPLILSFASPKVLGTVLSIGGSGMLIGSIVISTWGGPKRRIYGVLAFTLLQGILLFMGGLKPNASLIAATAFIFLFGVPIIRGSSQAIWQSKVLPDIQGRVFAVRRMIAWSSLPLAYLTAGPLADKIFEPLLTSNGLLAGNIGRVIGVGPGRGIGLLFVVLGVLIVLTTVVGYFYPRLRLIEFELPDVIADEALAKAD